MTTLVIVSVCLVVWCGIGFLSLAMCVWLHGDRFSDIPNVSITDTVAAWLLLVLWTLSGVLGIAVLLVVVLHESLIAFRAYQPTTNYRFCTDCRHLRRGPVARLFRSYRFAVCVRLEEVNEHDPVTGDDIPRPRFAPTRSRCSTQRSLAGRCQPEGIFWETRT